DGFTPGRAVAWRRCRCRGRCRGRWSRCRGWRAGEPRQCAVIVVQYGFAVDISKAGERPLIPKAILFFRRVYVSVEALETRRKEGVSYEVADIDIAEEKI